MTSPLFSTAYLPSVSYMAYLSKYDTVAIELKETFPKQTFRNRAVIATGNGLQMLNVPVERPQGNHTPTDQIVISYHEPWNVRHWKSIVTTYGSSPYFLYYRDALEEILLQRHHHLIDLNNALLRYLLKSFKIPCSVTYTDTFKPPMAQSDAHDFRFWLTDKHSLVKHPPLPAYPQVFDSRFEFQPNLSSIDLLFNLGPESKLILSQIGR